MEKRAAVPVTTPLPDPTVSYWQDPPASLASYRTTVELPSKASIVIIGSGITGSSLAYNLLDQPNASSIVMLEARQACSGATGRNGGHTKCASYRSFPDNKLALGEEEAVRIVRYEYACMKAVHAFSREHGISCDSWEGDTVDIFYEQKQWEFAHEAVAAIQQALGPDDPAARYRFWSAEEAAERFLTPNAYGALTYEAGSLSAYKFTIGVIGLCMVKGLNLQTETAAISVKQAPAGWTVETARGSIEAERVVLTTNGYTAAILPEMQGVIVPLRGHVASHRPGSAMPPSGLKNTYSFIYGEGYEYMISRPEGSKFAGDIVIGGGLTEAPDGGLMEFGTTEDTTRDADIMKYLRESTPRYFGRNWGEDNAAGRIRQAWTGIMGYSPDGFPFIGQVPGRHGLMIAASFQGHGMVLSFLAAKALAEMMLNEKSDDNEDLDRWFPKAFILTAERLKKKFEGRLHTKIEDSGKKNQKPLT